MVIFFIKLSEIDAHARFIKVLGGLGCSKTCMMGSKVDFFKVVTDSHIFFHNEKMYSPQRDTSPPPVEN
jgi:hypothetical protein